ncbi:hypothetical protein JGS22_018305 [Streptomyces sp. P38-E01]|uniref:DUF308 domain-containing protein n=1 Tax=Streptomyces tardus TaxID=2780544 RepID=A0A949JIY7_9ACTN|nr:hypothetical protein [Streptomyces tardus]MBU7599520.1 hypothetical protein [Streptomyces tardus]
MTEREHGRGEGREPLDEEAAWAQIVAGYDRDGRSPSESDPAEDLAGRIGPASPGDRPPASRETGSSEDGPSKAEDGTGGEDGTGARPGHGPDRTSGADEPGSGSLLEKRRPSGEDEDRPDGDEPGSGDGDGDSKVRTFTVYAAGTGPRDWQPAESDEDDHFVPPEPPPLPKLDTTARFAWLAVLGGPALLFGAVLFQIPMNWWITTLGIGGFLGGFGTLIARMRSEDDEEGFEDPGRGAVV